MIFIKFMRYEITKIYSRLTILGKLLLTLQVASMFIPIVKPDVKEPNLLLLYFFAISIIIYTPISLYIIVEYYSFISENKDDPIDDKDFLKITTIPFTIIAIMGIISFFIIEKIAIIQFISIIPLAFIIFAHIAYWFDNFPKIKIKLPKFNIKILLKKLFIKDVKHD